MGIIEGGCCNEENVHVLREFRRNCDVLIALGQCAIMGGLPAMRNAVMHSDEPLRECLEEAYITGRYIRNTTHNIPNDPALPLLLDKVYPCSDVVKIDHPDSRLRTHGRRDLRHAEPVARRHLFRARDGKRIRFD
jgi:NAD-reducing hydrogenase small subunit